MVPRRHKPRRNPWLNLLALIPVGLIALFMFFENREESARYEEHTREQARQAAAEAQWLAQADFGQAWSRCAEQLSSALSIYQQPEAIAWHRGGITAYFQQGIDQSSWRQARCAADGVSAGPRVRLPFAVPLLVEQPAEPDVDVAEDDSWALAVAGLGAIRLEGDLLGVELLRLPDGGVLRRDWRGLEGAAQAQLRLVGPGGDADAPFPRLYADSPFSMAPVPAALETLRGRNFAAEPLAALDLIAPTLPPGSLISEISVRPEGIEVTVTGGEFRFDSGDPAAPYAEMDFDEYGVAERSWWYPRQSPGFGCEQGRSLDQVRQMLGERSLRANPTLAWYSCSPAYSDKRSGVWHLR